MIGTLNYIKVRMRCHNPQDVKEEEFINPEDAIRFIRENM